MPEYWGILLKSVSDSETIEEAIERIYNSHSFALFTPAWGSVPKSQTDAQTIDEADVAAIAAHEADPDAHLEVGESLQSHKASEIIDHLASSIVADKIKDFEVYVEKLTTNKILLWPSFESLDAFQDFGLGELFIFCGGIIMNTLDTQNDYRHLWSESDRLGLKFFSKKPTLEMTFYIVRDFSQEIYLGVGGFDEEFIGVKIVDGTLYLCVTIDYTEHLFEIAGINITITHSYRINVVDNSTIEFYIDEVLIHTETSLTFVDNDVLSSFNVQVKNTSTTGCGLVIFDLKYFQDR